MKEKITAIIKDEDRTKNANIRRLVFALSTLPTVLNLLIYSLLIKEIRVLLLVFSAVAAVYFLLVFFFEIKDGEWSILALFSNSLVSLLTSIFGPLAYKIYLWFAIIALELVGMILLFIFRDRVFGRK